MKNTLVVGLGNLVLSDDAFGPLAVRFLQDNMTDLLDQVDFKENYSGSIDLLDDIAGYERLIVLDIIITGKSVPGTLYEVDLEQLSRLHVTRLVDSHGLNLYTVLEIGTRCGYRMPEQVKIIAVEGGDCESFSEGLTDAVQASFPAVLERVVSIVAEWDNVLQKA
ncbi:MAG: hydrogenase maturation protease [Planctomycetota bacterium]|jgi:hydrogenase maturation protease